MNAGARAAQGMATTAMLPGGARANAGGPQSDGKPDDDVNSCA